MVNIDVIKQRKEMYGNNFPEIARLWSLYTKTELSPTDVAMMMALMKITRMIVNGDSDSKMDMENYIWIAMNYLEYEDIEIEDAIMEALLAHRQ